MSVEASISAGIRSKIVVEYTKYGQLHWTIKEDEFGDRGTIIVNKSAIKKFLLPALLLTLSQCPEIFSDEEIREIAFQVDCVWEDRLREKEELPDAIQA